jgi:hypothetical protein
MGAGVQLAQRTGVVTIARGCGRAFAVFDFDAKDDPITEGRLQIGGDLGDIAGGHPVNGRRQQLGDERQDREACGPGRAPYPRAARATYSLSRRSTLAPQSKIPLAAPQRSPQN